MKFRVLYLKTDKKVVGVGSFRPGFCGPDEKVSEEMDGPAPECFSNDEECNTICLKRYNEALNKLEDIAPTSEPVVIVPSED